MPTFKHPCPHCGKYIDRDVAACPYCATPDPFAPARCPNCRTAIEDPGWAACPRCGHVLPVSLDQFGQQPAPTPKLTPAPTPTSTTSTQSPQSAATRCTGCGAPLAPGARFCTACGTLAG